MSYLDFSSPVVQGASLAATGVILAAIFSLFTKVLEIWAARRKDIQSEKIKDINNLKNSLSEIHTKSSSLRVIKIFEHFSNKSLLLIADNKNVMQTLRMDAAQHRDFIIKVWSENQDFLSRQLIDAMIDSNNISLQLSNLSPWFIRQQEIVDAQGRFFAKLQKSESDYVMLNIKRNSDWSDRCISSLDELIQGKITLEQYTKVYRTYNEIVVSNNPSEAIKLLYKFYDTLFKEIYYPNWVLTIMNWFYLIKIKYKKVVI